MFDLKVSMRDKISLISDTELRKQIILNIAIRHFLKIRHSEYAGNAEKIIQRQNLQKSVFKEKQIQLISPNMNSVSAVTFKNYMVLLAPDRSYILFCLFRPEANIGDSAGTSVLPFVFMYTYSPPTPKLSEPSAY